MVVALLGSIVVELLLILIAVVFIGSAILVASATLSAAVLFGACVIVSGTLCETACSTSAVVKEVAHDCGRRLPFCLGRLPHQTGTTMQWEGRMGRDAWESAHDAVRCSSASGSLGSISVQKRCVKTDVQ